ncbi:uncharacterized protein LOC117933410 [Vitis riparia]|uniref:uncharacterized protein LOC117933410 n=1 Tax=Vitis riparia TaxID=96939 RepID=UPI00155A8E6A|nr:uncharacterized protein LOC117933410 [Vitis riparia]
MLRRILIPGFAALLLILLLPITCKAKQNHRVCTSSCGNIHNISYPFRLKDDPRSCGESEYELACENNRTILYLYSGKYKVEEINYEIFTIRVVDDFSSLPLSLNSLTYRKFSHRRPIRYRPSYENRALNFIDCEVPISSSDYVDMAPCSKNSSAHFSLMVQVSLLRVPSLRYCFQLHDSTSYHGDADFPSEYHWYWIVEGILLYGFVFIGKTLYFLIEVVLNKRKQRKDGKYGI